MKKAMNVLVKIEVAAASLILAALILTTFTGVIARYVFSRPFTWEEEFQLACMVWISFLAAPIAFHTKSHVAIEILVEVFPKKVQQYVEYLIMVIVYIVLIYALVMSNKFAAAMVRSTPILKIPYKYVYGIAPISFILMLISYTYMTVLDIKERFFDKKEVEA